MKQIAACLLATSLVLPTSTVFALGSGLPRDANGDCFVDGDDFLAWQANFGSSFDDVLQDVDFNYDMSVDGDDFLVWQAHFGAVCDVPTLESGRYETTDFPWCPQAITPDYIGDTLVSINVETLDVCQGDLHDDFTGDDYIFSYVFSPSTTFQIIVLSETSYGFMENGQNFAVMTKVSAGLAGNSAASAAVPEPASLVLLFVLGAVGMLWRRARSC